MSLLTNYTKKQLVDKIHELTEKLKEMKQVEAQVNASVETLKDGSPAVGLYKDDKNVYHLVHIVYDIDKNAAAIVSKDEIGKDSQIAAYKLNEHSTMKIFMKARGGQYV